MLQNQHTLIAGRTGSGKTTLARALLQYTARAVIFDRKFEYNIPGSTITDTLEEAVHLLVRSKGGKLRLVFRAREPSEYLDLLEFVMLDQEENPQYGPVVVVMEEASAYSETYTIDSRVRTAYNQGRHMRLSLLTVIQLDTDIHRVTRANSEVIVTMAQNRLSSDMARYFRWEDVSALTSLRQGYVFPPQQGRHFLTYPPEIDLYQEWWVYHGYIMEAEDANNGADVH